ncbi:GNAT family N-acetyltransferase [Streptomyces lavendulae]|uniref:GNAT family N-acetyltransferase n=1 Tax=Streptomyces lavendulae TaxID=1914 RepID=UPI0033FD7890
MQRPGPGPVRLPGSAHCGRPHRAAGSAARTKSGGRARGRPLRSAHARDPPPAQRPRRRPARFERGNRAYFAASVPDRGDAFFDRFEELLAERLAEQASGTCHFHILTGQDGEILGRVNLVDAAGGTAELGCRIAEHATGRGLAGDAVRQACGLAVTAYGLTSLYAVTTVDNPASQAS